MLIPRQEGTLTQDQTLADARRFKSLLKTPELILRFSAARNAQPDSTSETANFVLELSMQHSEAAEAMAIFRKWSPAAPVPSPQAGPPRAVAADQGDLRSGGMVNSPPLNTAGQLAVPATLASPGFIMGITATCMPRYIC